MPAPQVILDLIARFQRRLDSYRSGHYNETLVRREFLDPFFRALGCDIDYNADYVEAYKDVIHEDAIKIDEAFCIRNEPAPNFQLRRGFDAVIGNPPYVLQKSLSSLKEYLAKRSNAFDGIANLYTYFVEKGVKLLRAGGLVSMIVTGRVLRTTYGESLHCTIEKHAAVRQIVDFGGLGRI